MKKLTFAVLTAALLLAAACAKKTAPMVLEAGSRAYTLGEILAARVPLLNPEENAVLAATNHFDITAGEVLYHLQASSGRRTGQLAGLPPDRLKNIVNQVIKQQLEKRLLVNAAKKAHIHVDQAEMDSSFQEEYQKYGGEEQFMAMLETDSIDPAYVKKSMEDYFLINQYLEQEVVQRQALSEEKIQEAYQEMLNDTLVSVRHVLLLTQGKSDREKEALRNKMNGILKRARAGEDFAELARTYSEDPGSSENGGLYEDVRRGMMVAPFEEACFNVPVGGISDIVETQYGFHIIQVLKRSGMEKPLEDVRDQLVSELERNAWRTVVPEHVVSLREKANVTLTDI